MFAKRAGFVVLKDMPRKMRKQDKVSLTYLLVATALTIIISYVPFAWVVVYPLRLFVTFIHEGGHALAALFTLGAVDKVVIYADASGETYTRGGASILIASAGYLASTAYGAGLLALLHERRRAKTVLTITAGFILVLTGVFAADPFSLFIGIALTAIIISIAIGAGAHWAHFFLSFLAVQCCLNAFYDLRTLFLISANTSIQSDALSMEQMTFIPAVFWAVFWIGLSIVTLIFGLKIYAQNLGLLPKTSK